jgi:hypothetical protein
MFTLNQILKAHPEWGDLDVVVYRSDGSYDYVGASGAVYEAPDENEENRRVLVFAGN